MKKTKTRKDSLMINEIQDFTYDAYIKFLNFLKAKYKIIPFCEVSKTCAPFLILRHDIDASLEAAARMAIVEHNLGIRSSYFPLFSHKLYNLHEKESAQVLRRIATLGHEVGLHYDLCTYESYANNINDALKNEVRILRYLLKKNVTTIARHNVSLMTKSDPFAYVDDYVNVYDPRLCDLYISDSCRAWYLKDLSRLLSLEPDRVQLLVHPVLWTENLCTRDAILENLFFEVKSKNDAYKRKWLQIYHQSPKVQEYDRSVRTDG